MLICLDSNIIISALGREKHSKQAQDICRAIADGTYTAVLSSIAYGEILGIKSASKAPAPNLNHFFDQLGNLSTVPADNAICILAAALRQNHNVKLPDALHLATAIHAKAQLFITNDQALAKVANKLMAAKTLSDF